MIHPNKVGQRGAVLFVGLIMLILITLIAVSAIRMAKTNMLIAGNEQFQMEAESAANYHLDQALNTEKFTDTQLLEDPNTLPAFAEGSAASDSQKYTVTINDPANVETKTKCKRYRYLKKSELVVAGNVVPMGNIACFGGTGGSGITMVVDAASLNDNSLCATSLWEMTAEVEVTDTGAKAQVVQGVEMRIDYAEAKSKCEKE